jgi:hypothetical protein
MICTRLNRPVRASSTSAKALIVLHNRSYRKKSIVLILCSNNCSISYCIPFIAGSNETKEQNKINTNLTDIRREAAMKLQQVISSELPTTVSVIV